ncbi:competence/damage-inducible protein A [Aphanothece hegewaldii CCALA 016]|uniref:CinA-like protein n=1 Tax=Aphanothece hegewaldii CCALA 016 TaxID=2107694 RepID=A0A2T1M2Q9_9CHRO|nr:competence/damage-inducible protein A [Aphanothece hegewaldii]PSF39030.1 competence/damage-inducible protein A [Aphanothece hegewaldii CCALA 016]
MSAELICVGTELLLGDILNSNAQYLAQEFAILGIPHYYQSVVGDNIGRVHQVIDQACQRSSILVFTGGLGPTPDDLTTEAIASYFNAPLIEDPDVLQDIKDKFNAMGRVMSPSNCKQALIPQGASVLPNPSGTAPGMIWQPRSNLTILTFPGVPSEMKRMWQETAVTFLKQLGWGQEIIYSRLMKFRGIGESALAEKVGDLLNLSNPTVAPYASLGEVKLRVSAKAPDETAALALIEPIALKIQEIAGLDYFGSDKDTLASVVGQLLREAKQTLSVAESCTGGGLGEMITTISGSSDYFYGGVISYDNRVKVALLDVNQQDLEQFGAVSHTVAQQMALGVKNKLKTDWGISITGIAGPGGGSEEKPVGLVYIGWATPESTTFASEYRLGQNRERETIRYISACLALDGLRRLLIEKLEKNVINSTLLL